jgi:hypothetical protein
MGVKITKNSFDAKKRTKEYLQRIAVRVKRAADLLVTQMVVDANAGKDINGNSFKAYSSEYRDWRSEQQYQTDPPNLTITGQMLKSMTASEIKLVGESRLEGQISFRDLQTIYTTKSKGGSKSYSSSTVDRAKFNNKTRRFFGITSKKRQFFIDYIQKG